MGSKISGTGMYVPHTVISNSFLESTVVGVNDEWTKLKLGISERRKAAPHESTLDFAYIAAMKALIRANVEVKDIDMIIVATITPSKPAPSTACRLAHMLGSSAPAFDLAAVCSGFYFAMITANQFIKAGKYKNVLIIGGDTFSRITDWSRRDCVFFGDGAGAIVLSASEEKGTGFLSEVLYSDGNDEDSFYIPAGGSSTPLTHDLLEKKSNTWIMDPKKVYAKAMNVLPSVILEALEKAKVTEKDIKFIIPHQPSLSLLKDVAKKANIPFSKVLHNMDKYANTGAGTIPILLDETVRAEKIQKDDLIVFATIGAGWVWGAGVFKWS